MSMATVSDDRVRWLDFKQELKEVAPTMGIDKIGFASADPFLTLKEILIQHREKGRESGFEERDIDKRVYPELTFEEPRSIISIAVAYPSKMNQPPKSTEGAYRGIISRSAWGQDYHHVLRNRLERLEAYIKKRVPEARTESMVDTGVLSDRAVAERAGIGWSGKNCAIITPEWGSWVYLGEMITNIPFEPDIPVTEDCGDCTICIDSCPTGALVGPGQLHSSRCVSFLTQSKEIIPDEYKEKIGNRLYGCDTCQVVCPKNKGMNWTHHAELQPDPEVVKPLLKPILTMSNKQFKQTFGHSAAAWRGKKPIQRNAIIGLGKFKDQSSIPLLKNILLQDERVEIRETAAWALGKIGGKDATDAIHEALQVEEDERVIEALHKSLSMNEIENIKPSH